MPVAVVSRASRRGAPPVPWSWPFVRERHIVRTMRKKLTRTGNSLALVLDRDLLDATGIQASTPLEISTDGEVIVISPVRGARRTERLRALMDRAHAKYSGVFRRLAE